MIAISYRREDSTPVAGRLHDRLRAEFGKENVFMDFDSIPYGVDFREHIKRTLERADVVVAVIGPGWLGEQRDAAAARRIDDPSDFVRLEIAGALQRGIPVIPILVDDTPMPKADSLPNEISAFAFRNALVLDTGIDFHHHADRLVTGIRELLKSSAVAAAIEPAAPEAKPEEKEELSTLSFSPPAPAPAEEKTAEENEEEKPIESEPSVSPKISAEEPAFKPKRTTRPRKPAAKTPKRIAPVVSSAEAAPAAAPKFVINWKLAGLIGGGAVALLAIYFFANSLFHRSSHASARSTSTFAESVTVQPSPSVAPSPAVVAAPTIAPTIVPAPSVAASATPVVVASLPPPPFSSPAATVASEPVYQAATPSASQIQDEENVRQLIRDYYAALSRHDLDTVVSKFGDNVDYQGQGHHDRRYIRVDTGNYLRRWDRIAFETGNIDVTRTPEGDFVATFNFPFAVGQGRASDKRGISSSVWILRKDMQGNIQIVSQREKVLAGYSKPRRGRN
jgi:ketosteroid isomerase-like protein